MAARRITITVGEDVLREVDRWVAERCYPNRSRAIQAALEERSRRFRARRLAAEAAKLDPAEEQALAEEGLGDESWPAY
jgi:metal-responsive CopG/Arc/MetJ family transcriptional regulator